MAVRLASPAVMPRAWRRVPGRPRLGGFTSRMIGLEGRLQWRQHKLFKLRARRVQCKNTIIYIRLCNFRRRTRVARSHPKFAIRSIVVRRTRNKQGLNSCPGRGAALLQRVHRRAGTVPDTGVRYGPALQRTAPQELRAALRPGNALTRL